MSWMAEYLVYPFVLIGSITGGSAYNLAKAVRELILVKETEQLKVALNTYRTYAPLSLLATIQNCDRKRHMH